MSIKNFFDAEGIEIAQPLISAYDNIGEGLITIAYGPPNGPPIPPLLLQPVVENVFAGTSASSESVLAPKAISTEFHLLLATDINTLIVPVLAAGFAGLSTPAQIGAPGIPIPVISTQTFSRFGLFTGLPPIKAYFNWAVSLLPTPDRRLTTPFTVT